MKFYSTFLIFICLSFQLFAQGLPVEGNKSELPNLKKESLQISTDVELYPNPAVDHLIVHLKNSHLKHVEVEMYNIIGNKLKFEWDEINPNKFKISVKDLHSGYYLIIIKDEVARYNKAFKFRKQ
ncbi:MAG: T9SS type A sorting domain-containing protein [Cyclobacteriaceae bacterium]|nr:T9SS type A sorting domain-containing protein [Cyclobacteriaceae bacterium]